MNKLILIVCYLFCYTVSAQKTVLGKISDTQHRPIAFVNIGIKGSKTGTVSDSKGEFKLEIPDSLKTKQLTFSSVGFEIKTYPIQTLVAGSSINVELKERITTLKEIQISNRKRKTYKLGITGRTPMIFIPAASYQQNDILEQARHIRIKEPVQILNANIFVLSTIKDDVVVRINFYAFVEGLPAERVIEKSIIRTAKQDKGWQNFDLTAEQVYMDKDFVVSFEFLPSSQHKIAFGAKIGAADSYVRNNSLGNWRKNEAGGCTMYVTVAN